MNHPKTKGIVTFYSQDNISEKQDARLKRIEFTSKAEEIRHLIAAEIGESESILLKGITEEERQIFIAIGERMLKNLDEANQ